MEGSSEVPQGALALTVRAAGRNVMRALRRTWKRLTGTFASARREDELAIEMQAHVEMQTEDNRACGIPEEEATAKPC